MKNVFLILGIMSCGVVCAAEASKKGTEETHKISRFVENRDGSWKVVSWEMPGLSELPGRPSVEEALLLKATLAMMEAHDNVVRNQWK